MSELDARLVGQAESPEAASGAAASASTEVSVSQELLAPPEPPQVASITAQDRLQSALAAVRVLDDAALAELPMPLLAAMRWAITPHSAALLDALCTLYYATAVTAMDRAAAVDDVAGMARAVGVVLALGPREVPTQGAFCDALWHGLRWYYADPARRPASGLLPEIEEALRRWGDAAEPDLDVLCDLCDFHFHAVWSFTASSTEQCRLALPMMTKLGQAMARSANTPGRPALPAELPPVGVPLHVGYLAMFADMANPVTTALRHLAPALLSHDGGFRLTVYAWCDIAPEFLDWLRSLGAVCHVADAPRKTDVVRAIEQLAVADPPAVLISDMNNGVPTAIFARRMAPVQVFLQGGMPAWPVPNLDGVFNSFGFDPVVAGWGNARMLSFNSPWDIAKLNPPEDAEEVAHQRAGLPQGLRLIGSYGRLVKLTEPCLLAAERILQCCPGLAFVTGGTGDASDIKAFIARSAVGERMLVVEGFVPGHSWGRFLDLFLDTWPVTGGESCREMIAKGRPVVTMHSDEMPAIDRQRDPTLVARNWQQYADIAVRLLQDPIEYDAACARATAFAQVMTDQASFAARLAADLDALVDEVRARSSATALPEPPPPPPPPLSLWARLRRRLNRRTEA